TSSRREPRISKRPAALSPCAVRLSFLLARRPVTRRAKACGRCPIDGGVHEFPLQGSEACRKRQKMRKRGATPATALSGNQREVAQRPLWGCRLFRGAKIFPDAPTASLIARLSRGARLPHPKPGNVQRRKEDQRQHGRDQQPTHDRVGHRSPKYRGC